MNLNDAVRPLLTFALMLSAALAVQPVHRAFNPPPAAAQLAAEELLAAVQATGTLMWIDDSDGVELLLAPGKVDACQPMQTWNVARVSMRDGKLHGLKTPNAVTSVRARVRGSGVDLVATGPRGVRASRTIPLWLPTCPVEQLAKLN